MAAKHVVIVTGANCGLGLKASLDMAKNPGVRLIMTGRSSERLHAATERVRETADPSSHIDEAVLDLASLESVRGFCTKIRDWKLSNLTILCNAGVQGQAKTLSKDGFESTFATNHLGHFALVTALLPLTRRVVVITSEVHDPAEKTPMPPPDVSDLAQLARGYDNFDGNAAYSTSKLCNLLFMFELLRRFPTATECIAYTPGFTPDTQLLRGTNMDIPQVLENCKHLGIRVSTTEVSGGFMARLCIEDWTASGWKSGMYIRVDEPYEPTSQAKDPALARELWELSEKLVASST